MSSDSHPFLTENPFAVRRICPDKFCREDRGDQVYNLGHLIRNEVVGVIGYTDASNVQLSLDPQERPFVCLFEWLETWEKHWCHVSASFLASFQKR
jgi:hypothetical protein